MSLTPIGRFATALQQQCCSEKFDVLVDELGADWVAVIPTVVLPLGMQEGDYPQPWTKPADLPADVVKGVFPATQRPFLALRYFYTYINEYVVEVFFQRYSSPTISNIIISPNGLIKEDIRELTDYKARWVSSCSKQSICPSAADGRTVEIIKNLLIGESLELTGGRYLLMHADKFIDKV